MKKLPRLKSVKALGHGALWLKAAWDDGYSSPIVDMTGVIARSSVLNVLSNLDDFARVRIVDYGSGIAWPNPNCPDEFDENAPDRLDFSASALRQIAEMQEPLSAKGFIEWQKRHRLNNAETARLFKVSLRTIDSYRSGESKIPTPIQITCALANSYPQIIEAHYEPSAPRGRPRKETEAA